MVDWNGESWKIVGMPAAADENIMGSQKKKKCVWCDFKNVLWERNLQQRREQNHKSPTSEEGKRKKE